MNGLAWPARYEIRVDGVLDVRWADWFGGLRVENNGSQTVIVGLLADQPALHRVLAKVRDLGPCLLSVHRIGPPDPGGVGDRSTGLGRLPDPAARSATSHQPPTGDASFTISVRNTKPKRS